MNNAITENLDVWTTSQTRKSKGRGRSVDNQSQHGIDKLRELILDLAVRGKLVPQDPNDEPASILLNKIITGRDKLIKEGKVKVQKPLPELIPKEAPLILPENWEMIRLGEISEVERGGSPRPIKSYITNDPDGINWIKIGDTDIGGKYISSSGEKIRKEGLSKTRMVYPGDFLLTNSMSFGRPYITKIQGCIHDGWLRINPPSSINKDFLYELLSSNYANTFFTAKASGAVVLNLNAEKVRELPILIPPIAEQHRIVAKVDELMALCDELEREQTKNNKAHEILVNALLNILINAKDQTDFDETWNRISKNFDVLFTTEQSIDKLKQTILQLAVMGKLVPQNPEDEPASILLEKIAKEKAKLVKEGKIKPQKLLPEIREDEKPFGIPIGWEWSRIGYASLFSEYGLSEKTFEGISGIPVLKMGDIQNGNILLGGQKLVPAHVDNLPRLLIKNLDILYNRTNSAELVGKTGIYEGLDDAYTFASYLIRIRCQNDCLNPFFLNHSMNSVLFRKTQIEPHLKQQCGQANVNGTILKNMITAIPPISEQKRIVEKVKELFAICDSLKQQIIDSQETKVQLANTIVKLGVI